ncbi:MAG: outer membrane beta-barrel protein [Terracidiphilus sp.]
MKSHFRMAVALSVAILAFVLETSCQAQTSTSSSDKQPAGQALAGQTPVVDVAAVETPATGSGAPASDAAPAAAPNNNATPATAATAPASVAVPLKSDAVLKELAEIKKQMQQMAQMEAAMKARMSKLENVLSDANSAEDADKDAEALLSAESGDGTGAPSYGQTATAATAAAAPAPPEIPAQTTTQGEPFPGDWTWTNNNGHASDSPMATKYFTPEFRADANYTIDMNHPEDDTLGGSTETFRSDEWQLEQVSIGGDIRIDNVRGRFLCLCGGLWAVTTTRNDPSVVRGDWDLSGAYKYVAEGWGGYHWNFQHGVNLDAGIFVSYIGLFSYYNFDNWTYQPSFVSSNTPWFFNGVRLQYFPTSKLKIEPWFINGWQTYARPNGKPGLGGQVLWRPSGWFEIVSNNYGLGEDDPLEQQSQLTGGTGATRSRIHTDNSIEVKYYDKPKNFMDKMAFTLTGDLGCEYGGGPAGGPYPANGKSPEMGTSDTYSGGVNCHNSANGKPKQAFAGWMAYQRFWFKKDIWAVTLGGGQMTNPGRYLTLLPPINAATAVTGSPYFTENPGDKAQMHDGTVTLDYMPSQFITFRLETGYRFSDVPYWTGHGGITPPGGANGNPADYQCAAGGDSGVGYFPTANGATAGFTTGQAQAISNCIGLGLNSGGSGTKALWWPDLRKDQTVATLAIMVRF